jgi:hypothetical protein
MKYIITDTGVVAMASGGYHQDLADALKGRVVAAGHCSINKGEVEVFGESIGFNIKAKPEDAARISEALRTH